MKQNLKYLLAMLMLTAPIHAQWRTAKAQCPYARYQSMAESEFRKKSPVNKKSAGGIFFTGKGKVSSHMQPRRRWRILPGRVDRCYTRYR
jgi:hypothetical protein